MIRTPGRASTSVTPTSPTPGAPAIPARMQDQLQLDIGRFASIAYVRAVSGADARVLRGGIAVGPLSNESAPVSYTHLTLPTTYSV